MVTGTELDAHDDLPPPEPPPDYTDEWAQDIYTHVTTKSNDNDETTPNYKPIVAKMVFDNKEQSYFTLDFDRQ